MSRRKRFKGNKIIGGFIPLPHNLIESQAFRSLGKTAKNVYVYFLRDIKSGHQVEITLTLKQAQKFGVCQSPTTFVEAKRELVKHGLLDPVDGGGLNAHAVFKISERWRLFGTDQFKEVKYKPGVGSKYFTTAMKSEKKKCEILAARHGRKQVSHQDERIP